MEVLAVGPYMFARGCVPHRAVLRRAGVKGAYEYITHVECVREDGVRGYEHGHYFKEDALAIEDFLKRAHDVMCGARSIGAEAEVAEWLKAQKEKK